MEWNSVMLNSVLFHLVSLVGLKNLLGAIFFKKIYS